MTSNPAKHKPRILLMSIFATILIFALAGFIVWRQFFQTYHLLPVEDGVLYRTGNRDLREFENTINRVKPKVVVSLIDDKEIADPSKPQFAQEENYLRKAGVQFIRLPITLGGWPTTENVRRFLSIVEDKNNQPVLIHCAQGVRRTGMMVAAFEESVLNWDDAKARDNIQSFGHSGRTTSDLRKFIEVYDGRSRSMTKELAPTGLE